MEPERDAPAEPVVPVLVDGPSFGASPREPALVDDDPQLTLFQA
jgi:hypothetical protein